MTWRKCSSCAKEIPFGGIYQMCSVSTCRKSAYCSVDCWDLHVPVLNHKNAWAEEHTAPQSEGTPRRRIVAPVKSREDKKQAPRDILIVASKLKSYIKARSDMNTSQNVLEALSDKVRDLCDEAIDRARASERKTVLDRDF